MAYGFGIIGCGTISDFHARAIADVRGAKLVACTSRSPAAAQRLAKSTGCTPYNSLDKLLADDRVNIVTIATPSGAHLKPAVAAAQAGKHVIVEKPLATSAEDLERITEAVSRAGMMPSQVPGAWLAPSLRLRFTRSVSG